jgi:hypothetical protein
MGVASVSCFHTAKRVLYRTIGMGKSNIFRSSFGYTTLGPACQVKASWPVGCAITQFSGKKAKEKSDSVKIHDLGGKLLA